MNLTERQIEQCINEGYVKSGSTFPKDVMEESVTFYGMIPGCNSSTKPVIWQSSPRPIPLKNLNSTEGDHKYSPAEIIILKGIGL